MQNGPSRMLAEYEKLQDPMQKAAFLPKLGFCPPSQKIFAFAFDNNAAHWPKDETFKRLSEQRNYHLNY